MRYYIRRQGVDNPFINTKVFIPSAFFENLININHQKWRFNYEKINKKYFIKYAL